MSSQQQNTMNPPNFPFLRDYPSISHLQRLMTTRSNLQQRAYQVPGIFTTWDGAHWNKNLLLSYFHSSEVTAIKRELVLSIFPTYTALPKQVLAVIIGIIERLQMNPANAELFRANPVLYWANKLLEWRQKVEEMRGRTRGTFWARLGTPDNPLTTEWAPYMHSAWRKCSEWIQSEQAREISTARATINLMLTSHRDAVDRIVRARNRAHWLEIQARQRAAEAPLTNEMASEIWGKVASAPQRDENNEAPTCYLCLEEINTNSVEIKPFKCQHSICLNCAKNMRIDYTNSHHNRAHLKQCGICRESGSDYIKKHFCKVMDTFAEFY